ncbi:MAG: hypothetical protein OXC26_14985 [Albidovulum sp.]|nr:hypothetical protein [Albidovulum sp.]
MLWEVFAGFRSGHSTAAHECDGEVAQFGELSCVGACAAAIHVESDVAEMMQTVFDGPVGVGESEKALGAGPVRQACDEISGLDALAPADPSSALKPHGLREARPVEISNSLGR